MSLYVHIVYVHFTFIHMYILSSLRRDLYSRFFRYFPLFGLIRKSRGWWSSTKMVGSHINDFRGKFLKLKTNHP